MEKESGEPQATTTAAAVALPDTPRVRHDGWTGEKMAQFCETLAETGIVQEGCEQARMSVAGAYAHRRRSPIFAAAWEAALTIARERLADTLLARAIEGNAEQIYRDGVLVGERHVIDNRLGLAILRRLDRLAEAGTTASTRGRQAPTPVRPERSRGASTQIPFDWDLALDALRTGDPDAIAASLAMFRGEVEEVEDPPVSRIEGDKVEYVDLWDRCRKDDEGNWVTDFPPPPGFDGFSCGEWNDSDYERSCTDSEAEVLQAHEDACNAADRAAEEARRDEWFDLLRQDLPDAEAPTDQAVLNHDMEKAD